MYFEWIQRGLLYVIAGMLYTLLYTLLFKPKASEAYLGLMILFWPFWIALEILLTFAKSIGTFQRTLTERFNERVVTKIQPATVGVKTGSAANAAANKSAA